MSEGVTVAEPIKPATDEQRVEWFSRLNPNHIDELQLEPALLTWGEARQLNARIEQADTLLRALYVERASWPLAPTEEFLAYCEKRGWSGDRG